MNWILALLQFGNKKYIQNNLPKQKTKKAVKNVNGLKLSRAHNTNIINKT